MTVTANVNVGDFGLGEPAPKQLISPTRCYKVQILEINANIYEYFLSMLSMTCLYVHQPDILIENQLCDLPDRNGSS
jgi:hypothetical protein